MLRAGIVCCSNSRKNKEKKRIDILKEKLKSIGIDAVVSKYIYSENEVFSAKAEMRANELMKFYKDKNINVIFDISGGDIANEILPYMDYEVIANSDKLFWGYSDLTTIINSIFAKAGKSSVLYQIRNILENESLEVQVKKFFQKSDNELFSFNYKFINGEKMQGVVIGGNIRCFLKLAGTEYFPNPDNKLLLLESRNGTVASMITYLNQLKQMKVFDKISGIILGTFTQMESNQLKPSIEELVLEITERKLPIIKTNEIGHNVNSKAIIIGNELNLSKF